MDLAIAEMLFKKLATIEAKLDVLVSALADGPDEDEQAIDLEGNTIPAERAANQEL